jgi:translation initiation factor IF-2
MVCSVIYKLLDDLSMRLVEAAPTVKEEALAGRAEVLALFSASVKKSVNKSGKMVVAGCKARCPLSVFLHLC